MRTSNRRDDRTDDSPRLALHARPARIVLVAALCGVCADVCAAQRTCVRVSVNSEGEQVADPSY